MTLFSTAWGERKPDGSHFVGDNGTYEAAQAYGSKQEAQRRRAVA